MSQFTVASQYADAVFVEALSSNQLDTIINDLNYLQTVNSNDDFIKLTHSDSLSSDDKERVVNRLGTSGSVSRLVHGLLVVLIRNDRLYLLTDVIDAVNELIHNHKNEVEVFVKYAKPISDKTREKLILKLKEITDKEIILHESIDPTLIEGAVISLGSTLYDMSVKGKLEKLKQKLTK